MRIVSKFADSGKIFFESCDYDLPSSGIKILDLLEEGDFGKTQIKEFVQNNLLMHYSFNRFAKPTNFIFSVDTDIVVNTLILNSDLGVWNADYEPYLIGPNEVFTNQVALKGEVEFCAPQNIELFRIFTTPEFYIDILDNYGHTFKEIIERIQNRETVNVFLNPFPVSPKMKMIIKEIFSYKNSNEIITRNFVKNKLLEIIHLQLEYLIVQSSSHTSSKLSSIDKQKIQEAQKILKINYQNPPTIKQLAAMLATNEFKLKSGFSQMYSTSIYQYVIELRIEKAINLMDNKNISLEQISETVGYANLSNFTRVFKKVKGVSPSEYRASFTCS